MGPIQARIITSAPPFVGRCHELARLGEDLEAAREGHPRVVCIEGPPGVGKTALVRAFLDGARDLVVLHASGDEDEADLEWGVLQQLALGPLPEPAKSLKKLPDATPYGNGVLEAGARLLAALGALEGGPPAVVVVDDAHYADPLSAGTLRFAARRLSGEHLLLLVTIRPVWSGSPAEAWTRLSRERGRHERLSGLGPSDLALLAEAMAGRSLTPRAARRLWEHTEGHPMHAKALLEELGPELLESPTAVLPAPRPYAELILDRVAGCSPESGALLRAAAVLGQRSPLGEVLAVADLDNPGEALSEVVVAGLLSENGVGPGREVAFPHPLVRAAIYRGLSPAKRSELHATAARLFTGNAALQHRVAASIGPDEQLAAELEAAADEAVAMRDMQSAAQRMAQAVDTSQNPAERGRRLLAACEMALAVGDVTEVEDRRRQIEDLEGPRRDLVLARLAFYRGRTREAGRRLGEAWEKIAASGFANRPLAARVALEQGFLSLDAMTPDRALAWSEKARELGCGETLASAEAVRVLASCVAGLGAQAISRANAGPAEESRTPDELAARATVHLVTDDVTNAARDLGRILSRLGPGERGGLVASAAANLAHARYRQGDLDAASVAGELGVVMAQESGVAAALVAAHAAATWPLAAQARWEQAEAHWRAATALAGESRSAELCVAGAGWAIASARRDAEAMLATAREFADLDGAEEPGFFPFGPLTAEPLILLGRLDEAESDLDRFEDRVHRSGRLSALTTAFRVRGMLEAAGDDRKAARAAFESAIRIAKQLRFRLEEARAQAAWAEAMARWGERRAARVLFEDTLLQLESMEAHAFAATVKESLLEPARRTGLRRGQDEGFVGLTPAETAVANLVMSGLSNPEVAGRLFVSRKAVEYHLVNIYAKLGISSRTQLILHLGTPAPVGAESA